MPLPTSTQANAQRNAHGVLNVNNGNPGGAHNTAPSNAGIPMNAQSFMSDYAIRQGGQSPELARYRPPQYDLNGNSVGGDVGGYSYNLPNAYGNGGINPMYPGGQRSAFNPVTSNQENYLRELLSNYNHGLAGVASGGASSGALFGLDAAYAELDRLQQSQNQETNPWGFTTSRPSAPRAEPVKPGASGGTNPGKPDAVGNPLPTYSATKPGGKPSTPSLGVTPPSTAIPQQAPRREVGEDFVPSFRQRAMMGEFIRPRFNGQMPGKV